MATLYPTPKRVEARTAEEWNAIHEGVRLYLKNLKAATGTATGIGKHDVAAVWREEAEHVEQGLMARLNEENGAFPDRVGPMALAGDE